MKKDITLLILAAGMGSRFGGLKQIEGVGPNGEYIIDYSIYDALLAGFTKVVFLIKEENYEVFKETVGKRVEKHIKVDYCFQKNDNIPSGYNIPKERVKPLGTAHAILCCKDKIKEPFAIINADDFYGRDAYIKAYNFLVKGSNNDKENYGLVAYNVENTITLNGSVKRGICDVENNKLKKIVECSVEKVNNQIVATPLNGDSEFVVSKEQVVSMNMLLFKPGIFKYIEDNFSLYLEQNKDNLMSFEYLIPDVLYSSIVNNYATVDVIPTSAVWYGMTYKEDLDYVKTSIKKLIDSGEYKNNLW